MPKPGLLIVDDNGDYLQSLSQALREVYEVRCARSREEAEASLSPPPDVILLDIRLKNDEPSNRDGVILLEWLHAEFPGVPVLMITGHGDVGIAVECMQRGAADFIEKRTDIRQLKSRLAKALEISRRITKLEEDGKQLHLLEPRLIIGNCPQIREIKKLIKEVAEDGKITVLLRGPTGTGKELVARAIHANGPRKSGPFVPVTLAVLPAQTVEGELFGYEPGAFTDARKRHIGYLEKAHGGVLFLDEISEVAPQVQMKLLRFLEEREFHRLGRTEAIRTDVQVVAATNADLEQLVQLGRFREDLYYRLKVQEIVLPPLRDRKEDIGSIVSHYMSLFQMQGVARGSIAGDALGALQSFDWPGNVRQLKAVLESATLTAKMRHHSQVLLEDLPVEVRTRGASALGLVEGEAIPARLNLAEERAAFDLQMIQRALKAADGKKTDAWKLLGLTNRFGLNRLVQRHLSRYPTLADRFPFITACFPERGQGH